MDIFTALHTRRSVRAYTDEPISADEIQIMLDAAMIAPSAGNARPWQFIVIDDPALLAVAPSINKYAGMVPNAAAAILVCGDLSLEKYPGFWVQDCSAAIQNMMLAATGQGLGTVWTAVHPVEERVSAYCKLFALPPSIVPLALIAVGKPQKPQERLSRYEPQKIHYNAYGEPWENE
ncbi:MAG: nitroreductase family protein [Desulfovibrionaceae bacterium]|nr:nitroreductase family protein [Desulfovibrionaceae bacterium]